MNNSDSGNSSMLKSDSESDGEYSDNENTIILPNGFQLEEIKLIMLQDQRQPPTPRLKLSIYL